MTDARSRGRFGLALTVLALAGLAIASYLLAVRVLGEAPACGPLKGCDTVAASEYSTVLGIPVALVGVVYSVVLVAASVTWWRRADRRALYLAYGLTLAGIIAVIYLTYLEIFVIEAICVWCVSYAVTIVAGWFVAFAASRSPQRTTPEMPLRDIDGRFDRTYPPGTGTIGPGASVPHQQHTGPATGARRSEARRRPSARGSHGLSEEMTTNLLHKTKSSDGPSPEKGLAIGETDAHVFNCPACARPLSEGTSKCPGCGVHLIMGVRVKRAGAILALGVVLGVLVGGLTTAAAITLGLGGSTPAIAAMPSAPPSAAPSATVIPSYVPDNPEAPAAAVSALSGTAVVNGRIAVDAQTLSTTLARSGATTTEIARALRSLAADAALGIDLAARLATWSDAAQVQTALDDFYRSMAQVARTGLRYSLADTASYRSTGAKMLDVLTTLRTVDSQSRSLAGTVDLELPPVAIAAAP